jgi:protein SERAC1
MQTERPIITIAHSLGGLVCAQVIVSGDRAAAEHDIGDIARNIKGMIFLGTPFGGSPKAKWGELVRRVWSVVKATDKNTLQTLKADSYDLKNLRDAFPDIIQKRNTLPERIGIVFFYERLPTYGNQVCFLLRDTLLHGGLIRIKDRRRRRRILSRSG